MIDKAFILGVVGPARAFLADRFEAARMGALLAGATDKRAESIALEVVAMDAEAAASAREVAAAYLGSAGPTVRARMLGESRAFDKLAREFHYLANPLGMLA